MSSSLVVRQARASDAPALLSIYRPFVEHTAVSFETQPPSVDEFAERIEKALVSWQWLVAEDHGQAVGYAYGSSHRERPAYRWSAEVSAYVASRHHRRGVGLALYARLLNDLAERGICHVYAGISLPNDASVALHRRAGFSAIGVFNAVGRKFETWHDVAWFQKALRESPLTEPPA